jgi:hypothetical protein
MPCPDRIADAQPHARRDSNCFLRALTYADFHLILKLAQLRHGSTNFRVEIECQPAPIRLFSRQLRVLNHGVPFAQIRIIP